MIGATSWLLVPRRPPNVNVTMPIFQFLLCRWYFRLCIWARFLWQVSRIRLDLLPAHPDRLGGLGYLSNTVYAFGLLLTAHGALLAAQLANRILYVGAALPDFKVEIATLVAFLLYVVVGPLLAFYTAACAGEAGRQSGVWHLGRALRARI